MAKVAYRKPKPPKCPDMTRGPSANVGGAVAVLVLALLAGALACVYAIGYPVGLSPLDIPLLPTEPRQSVPLQEALIILARSPRQGFVLFGLEERLTEGKEPAVTLNIGTETTLGAALGEIIAQLPSYEMEVASDHLINFHLRGAKDAPGDLLNLRVATFDAVSKPAYDILEDPRYMIPELNEALRPKPEAGKVLLELYSGGPHGGPRITLHLKNVTIRDILNATSIATEASFDDHKPDAPRGWVCVFNPDAPSGNSKYSFRTLFSLPAFWHYGARDPHKPSNQ